MASSNGYGDKTLPDMQHADVIVLGAGIVGVCTALHLQKAGLSTVLVDRRAPGEETSFGNAGLIERSSIFPYMFPRDFKKIVTYALNGSTDAHYHLGHLLRVAPWLLRYWRNSSEVGTQRSLRANLPLIENCLIEHEKLAAEAGVMHLLKTSGWIRLARTRQGLAEAASEAADTAPYGVRHGVLDARSLLAIEPHLSDEIIGGVHYHDPVSVSDPHALTMGYAALFEALGGRFERADARSLAATQSGWAVKTAAGAIGAGASVVALGPWSNAIAANFGYRLPMEIKRGYHMHYALKGNATLNRPVLDGERGYMLAPMARGIRLTTGAEFAAIDAPKTPVQLDRTEPLARKILPLGDRLDAEPWMGRRPCFPDMVPVIGAAPRHEKLWFAYGHQHHGLTNAAVTGRLVAEMVSGAEPFIDPAPYRLDRF